MTEARPQVFRSIQTFACIAIKLKGQTSNFNALGNALYCVNNFSAQKQTLLLVITNNKAVLYSILCQIVIITVIYEYTYLTVRTLQFGNQLVN